ncbi:MAG TPA: right-handed parallel beta-helix repeat-containing protein [Acidimicrobiales bacterium]|nr:right-handed parallel beta-helix repeat-containing protein [Acidimicrobiales bacterium]
MAGLVALGAVLAPAAAQAGPVGCGSVITQSTTLTADVGPCNQGGLIIRADNITVDLGGRTVAGKSRTADGIGILLDGVSGVTLKNGSVRFFDAGVVVLGGGGNTVTGLNVRDNIGSIKTNSRDNGDGISVRWSNGNTVSANAVVNNGPFGGITVLGTTSATANGNVVTNNRVTDNDVPSGPTGPNQDDGIRVEGPNASGTQIIGNTVTGNGLDGVAVFADQGTGFKNTGTIVSGNSISGNGFHEFGHRKGDGIVLFGAPGSATVGGADNSLVTVNSVQANAANGIRVASKSNVVDSNFVQGNAAYPGVTAFDRNDANLTPPCDNNTWTNNGTGTRNQDCIS